MTFLCDVGLFMFKTDSIRLGHFFVLKDIKIFAFICDRVFVNFHLIPCLIINNVRVVSDLTISIAKFIFFNKNNYYFTFFC